MTDALVAEIAALRDSVARLSGENAALKRIIRVEQQAQALIDADKEIPSLGTLVGELKVALKDYKELADLRRRCAEQRRHITELREAVAAEKVTDK